MRKIIFLVGVSLLLSGYTPKEFKISGYYPFTAKKNEKNIEGGIYDKFGHILYTLCSNKEYVSIAVDRRVIPLNTYLLIDAFPNKIFKAVDIGRKVKGKHLDICVWDKKIAHQLPKKANVIMLDKHFINFNLKKVIAWIKK